MLWRDDGTEWSLLGTFAGGALVFVRELLQGEGVAYREAPLPSHDGDAHGELWVAAGEHERAAALLAGAQADAEAAALREAAALAAAEARAAEEAARAAEKEARLHAAAGRHAAHVAARRAAKEARRAARRAGRVARQHARAISAATSASQRGMRIVGGLFVLVVLVLVAIVLVGERFGTQPPVPAHKVESCGPRQLLCPQ